MYILNCGRQFTECVTVGEQALSSAKWSEESTEQLAGVHGELAAAMWGLKRDRDLALMNAWKAIELHKSQKRAAWVIRADFQNAFNHINFTTNTFTKVGGFTSDNFGQINAAYQDTANRNETGGRMIQLVLRFNF